MKTNLLVLNINLDVLNKNLKNLIIESMKLFDCYYSKLFSYHKDKYLKAKHDFDNDPNNETKKEKYEIQSLTFI